MFFPSYLEIRRTQILAEMDGYQQRLLEEMGDVDRETLAKLRDLVSDYYNAKADLALSVEGVEKLTADALANYQKNLQKLNDNFIANLAVVKNDMLQNAGVFSVLPTITAADNGKLLQVVNGVWSAVEIPFAEEVSV